MGARRPIPTYPLGRELVREATDALRIRSDLPRRVARSATRYFDLKHLIKPTTRRRVHRALADLLASGLPVKEGPEHAALALADALDDVVRWWDAAATTVNALPLGTGHERLGMLPGVRLLALDISIRLGALLALCDAADDLELGSVAACGRSFLFVVSRELRRSGMRERDLRPPNAPTRNAWRAWRLGTLPRARNVKDLPDAFEAAGWTGAAASLRARLRLAVALDELHAWATRKVDAEYAAGLVRFTIEVGRLVSQQPSPGLDDARWRPRLWEIVRAGARAQDASFPLQCLAAIAEPAVGIEAAALRREPSAILVRWAVALAGATATSSDLARSRLRRGSRTALQAFESAASRALRPKPVGYGLPGGTPPTLTKAVALEGHYWMQELLGAHAEQRDTAAALVQLRPADVRLSLLEARAMRLCGDAASAKARCRALAERRPRWPAPLVELARIEFDSDAYDRAAALLDRAQHLGADDDEVITLLASARMSSGSYESARTLLSALLERSPMHSTAAALMAVCCARIRGCRREARRWAKHAARLGLPDALEWLGKGAGAPTLPSVKEEPPAAEPDRSGSPATRPFIFTITPASASESDPGPWHPNWRPAGESR